MKKIFVICFAFVMTFLSCNAKELSANQLYEQKVNSIFYVKTQNATGSGIVLKEDGTFVTCFHVIADANYIKVKTKNGEEYKVTGYKYLDPVNDVAILTIKSNKKFLPITLKDSNSVKVGDNIYTISNPIGLQFVFSSGMVNQLDKDIIQFSAPSSPGSSGGALLDANGSLIGMITSQLNPSKAQNINFAIPNKFYMSYIDNKTKNNSKNELWYDFVASKLNKKELKQFISYAYKNNDFSMMYKYMSRSYDETDTSSEDYAFMGTVGIMAYMEEMDNNKKMSDDIAKWFALSINSNKNVELSAFGLYLTGFLDADKERLSLSYDYLKLYPKTLKKSVEFMEKYFACSKNDNKQRFEILSQMFKYYMDLSKKVYIKE